jgi:uncharacterized protein YukE
MLAGGSILGADAIPGDVGGLEGLAGQLSTTAADVQSIQSRISSEGLAGSWSGHAADAFRAALNDLPAELEKLHGSFGAAAQVLRSYSSSLGEFQGRADWYAEQIEHTEGELRGAQQRHSAAQSDYTAATHAYVSAGDPITKASAQQSLDHAGASAARAAGEVDEISGRISSLRTAAHANRREFEVAASACCSGLDSASHLGIRNSFSSWWDRNVVHGIPGKALHDVEGAVAWTGHEIEDAGKSVVHWAETTVKDVRALLDRPSWDTLRAVIEDLKGPLAVAGVLLAIAAVVVAPESLPFLLAASADLTEVNAGLDVAVASGDGVAALEGDEEARSRLIGDAADLALDEVSVHDIPDDEGFLNENAALRSKLESRTTLYELTGESQWKSAATHYQEKMLTADIAKQDELSASFAKDFAVEHGRTYLVHSIGDTAAAHLTPSQENKVNFHEIVLPSVAEAL